MEDGLEGTIIEAKAKIMSSVLILVLVEDGLEVSVIHQDGGPVSSLNPCFSGRWS
mgnify:FL=1